MQERLRPIATEWYRPVGAFETDFKYVLEEFYGTDSIALCRSLIAGQSYTRQEAKVINSYFLRSSKKAYNLPRRSDPQKFFLEQAKGAVSVVKYFPTLVPELATDLELNNKIALYSERPSDLLRMLSSSNLDQRLAYEAQRQAILMYQLGMFNARTLNGKLRTLLADVQDLLDEKLYEGAEGHTERIISESFHDDDTNQVVGFPNLNTQRPFTSHLKRESIWVRRIPGIGEVNTSERKKDDSVAIIKSWVKALHNGGEIHIDQAVQDSIGMIFVARDFSVPPEQLADLVISVIKSGAESRIDANHARQTPRIVKVEQDDKVNKDHGQACDAPFNARRKIWFDGIRTPIELIFYDRETYLNSRFEVGNRDLKTGLYMGRSHELFELRRAREAIRVPFPKEIYPVDDYDVNMAFVNRSKQIAYGLRNMHRAA